MSIDERWHENRTPGIDFFYLWIFIAKHFLYGLLAWKAIDFSAFDYYGKSLLVHCCINKTGIVNENCIVHIEDYIFIRLKMLWENF